MSEQSGCVKNVLMFAVGLFCVGYLLNPTAGLDFLPDNLPLVGNLDEATAVVVLLACLRHFGIDIDWLFNLISRTGRIPTPPPTKSVDARVVDEDDE